MAKKQHPPQSWWKQYEIAVKVTYEHARKKLNDSQFHSDLASETEMPPLKRRRRPPAVWSDSDSEEEEEDSATSQPGLPPIQNNFTSGTQLSETNSPQGTSDNHSVDADFQWHVLRLLNTLRFMLEQQADTLNKLCDILPTFSVTECAELLGHPLSSLEELQEFDDKLDAGKFRILMLLAKRQTQLLLTLRPLSNRGSGMPPSALPPSFRSQSKDNLSKQQIRTETFATAQLPIPWSFWGY
ncbi:hypothetical protein HPB49_008546 [Dermacentor silvarum]|uniref:Uncharacterized protein n=1 Tax=Dermacentor silvarum TaxID=543639 RepID=A0ACB8CDX9_DERSI|nr:hypothetical protein HPB49_008546 [Dermacentor silvarum]